MDTYTRLDYYNKSLKKERQSIVDSMMKTPPSDYAGVKYLIGKVNQLDQIITELDNILKGI